MQYGTLRPQVGISGTWEKVDELTVGALASNTNLLLRMQGANASTAILDSGSTGHTVTANGSAQLTNSITPPLSNQITTLTLNGTTDYLSIPDHNDWNFGTGNWTIDFWIYYSGSTDNGCVWGQYTDGSNFVTFNVLPSTNTIEFDMLNSSSPQARLYLSAGAGVVFTTGQWYHIAFTRESTADAQSSWGMYVNGSRRSPSKIIGATWVVTFGDYTGNVNIGRFPTGSDYLNAEITQFRVSKGVARWTSNFTPPTAPYDGPTNQVTFSGLSGNTDEVYLVKSLIVNNSGSNLTCRVRPNNDGGTNYGYQVLQANSTTVSSARSTTENGMPLVGVQTGTIGYGDMVLFAKSGDERSSVSGINNTVTGTTVTTTQRFGLTWSNTADEITSLACAMSSVVNGIDSGSYFALYRKVA